MPPASCVGTHPGISRPLALAPAANIEPQQPKDTTWPLPAPGLSLPQHPAHPAVRCWCLRTCDLTQWWHRAWHAWMPGMDEHPVRSGPVPPGLVQRSPLQWKLGAVLRPGQLPGSPALLQSPSPFQVNPGAEEGPGSLMQGTNWGRVPTSALAFLGWRRHLLF